MSDDITKALKANMEASKKKIQGDIAREMSKRGLLSSSTYSDEMAAKLTDLMARHNIDVAQVEREEKRYQDAKEQREKEEAKQARNQLINTLLNTATNVGFIAGGIPNIFGKKGTSEPLTPNTAAELPVGAGKFQLKLGEKPFELAGTKMDPKNLKLEIMRLRGYGLTMKEIKERLGI